MDYTGKIAGAYRELQISQESDKIRQEPQPLPQGPFRVGVVDPPWEFEEGYSLSRLGVTPHPTMSIGEIKKLPIPSIMHEDSVIWLWTTNRHLAGGEAGQILKHWGFRPLSLLTWLKDRPGTGVWLSGQTEACHPLGAGQARPAPVAREHLASSPPHRHPFLEARRLLRTRRPSLPRLQGRDLRTSFPSRLDDLGE